MTLGWSSYTEMSLRGKYQSRYVQSSPQHLSISRRTIATVYTGDSQNVFRGT